MNPRAALLSLGLLAGCNAAQPAEANQAVADAVRPEVRYYVIADT